MAAINPLGRELVLKVVFYGPGLGGKTTTLQHLHDSAKPEHRGKLVSLATEVDRTLYFDFLPLRVPKTRGMSVRLQLFTVPGQVHYNSTRKLVLTGADGVVFVADSQSARADANQESLDNLEENLREQGRELSALPHVMQYNKRDLDEISPRHELEALLNRYGARSVPTVARTGEGVYEVLTLITQASLAAFQANLPEATEPTEIAFGAPEDALGVALRRGRDDAEAPRSRALVVHENLIEAAPRVSDAPVETPRSSPLAPPPVPSAPRPATDRSPGRERTAGLSLVASWPEEDRAAAEAVERLLGAGSVELVADPLSSLVEALVLRAAVVVGEAAAPRHVPLAADLSARRWWAARATLERARRGAANVAEVARVYALLSLAQAELASLGLRRAPVSRAARRTGRPTRRTPTRRSRS